MLLWQPQFLNKKLQTIKPAFHVEHSIQQTKMHADTAAMKLISLKDHEGPFKLHIAVVAG